MDEGVGALFSLPHRNLISSYHNVLGVGICGHRTMVPSVMEQGKWRYSSSDSYRAFSVSPFLYKSLYSPHPSDACLTFLIRRTHHRPCGSPYFFPSFLFRVQ